MTTNYGARPRLSHDETVASPASAGSTPRTMSADGFALRIGRARVVLTVATMAEASRVFLNAQRVAMERGSDIARDATLYDASMARKVARLSQNGKVWPLEKWYVGQEPLFDPYESAIAQARGSRDGGAR